MCKTVVGTPICKLPENKTKINIWKNLIAVTYASKSLIVQVTAL